MIHDVTGCTIILNNVKATVQNTECNIKERLIKAMRYMKKHQIVTDNQMKLKFAVLGTVSSFPKNSHEYNALMIEIEIMQFFGGLLQQGQGIHANKLNFPKGFKPIGIVKLWQTILKETI